MSPTNYLSPVPFHGLPGHSFLYLAPLRAPSPLSLSLPIPPPRNRDKYASYVWNAAIVLADAIAAEEVKVKGKRVLELGCGLGLPGIVAARLGAEKVILSDYNDGKMLLNTTHAVEEALSLKERKKVQVVGHTWGESIEPILRASPSYDLILVADCVWDASLHLPLIITLSRLLAASPSATVLFSAGFHTGRLVVAAFLERAEEEGLVMLESEEWREVSVEGEERLWSWQECWGEEAKEDRQEERNRWTLLAHPAKRLSNPHTFFSLSVPGQNVNLESLNSHPVAVAASSKAWFIKRSS
ncbi:hypothetical protein JCM8547_001629 [Rhodosporidiobolus lusitaniae]